MKDRGVRGEGEKMFTWEDVYSMIFCCSTVSSVTRLNGALLIVMTAWGCCTVHTQIYIHDLPLQFIIVRYTNIASHNTTNAAAAAASTICVRISHVTLLPRSSLTWSLVIIVVVVVVIRRF